MTSMKDPAITLLLGGQRSGKSRFAEALIGTKEAYYIATALPSDPEMTDRIMKHKKRRGNNWVCLEAPLHLATALETLNNKAWPVLVDCLTLWLSQVIMAKMDCQKAVSDVLRAAKTHPGDIIFISSEVGLGIIPDNPLARRFADCSGEMNQRVANIARKVVLVTAGLPLVLKEKSL